MKKEIEIAKELAVRAGTILMKHYSEGPAVDWKGTASPVTAADRSAGAFLVEELRRQFPEDGILCEEEADKSAPLTQRRIWVIDPMDGTKQFINRLGEFAVMIGMAVDGIATLGVVYQPTMDKLYVAASGMGAFLVQGQTTRPLRVSPESDASAMTIALSRSHNSPPVEQICQRLGVRESIRTGSIGIKVGLICEGRAHLYLHTQEGPSQWDTCAPEAILREAGGRMTDLSNNSLRYDPPGLRHVNGVIASSGAIHNRIVEVARSVLSGTRL